MDFNPKMSILRSQKEVDAYLAKYNVRLPSNVQVEWCPPKKGFTAAPCMRRRISSFPDLGVRVRLPL